MASKLYIGLEVVSRGGHLRAGYQWLNLKGIKQPHYRTDFLRIAIRKKIDLPLFSLRIIESYTFKFYTKFTSCFNFIHYVLDLI